jgi:hypothetical protein
MKVEKVDSILPNINLSSGYAIGILGNTLRAIGSLRKALAFFFCEKLKCLNIKYDTKQ